MYSQSLQPITSLDRSANPKYRQISIDLAKNDVDCSRRQQGEAIAWLKSRRRLGNVRILFVFKDGSLWVLGPHWPYSVVMLAIILVVGGGFTASIIPVCNSPIHSTLTVGCFVLSVSAFIGTVIRDPGIVWSPRGDEEGDWSDGCSTPSHSSRDTEGDKNNNSSTRVENLKNVVQVDVPATKKSSRSDQSDLGLMENHDLGDSDEIYTLGDSFMDDTTDADSFETGRIKWRGYTGEDSLAPAVFGNSRHKEEIDRISYIGPVYSSGRTMCPTCRVVPPSESAHCSDCNVCVEGFDHHCPWTSKCIGKGNAYFFYVWILCSLVTIVYMGVVAAISSHSSELD